MKSFRKLAIIEVYWPSVRNQNGCTDSTISVDGLKFRLCDLAAARFFKHPLKFKGDYAKFRRLVREFWGPGGMQEEIRLAFIDFCTTHGVSHVQDTELQDGPMTVKKYADLLR